MFSETVKEFRIRKRVTLRDFCQRLGLDPSNWSKVERGINPPPSDVATLDRVAKFFGLQGDERLKLIDAAALQRREIPPDLADHVLLQKALPTFFRAARGHELSEEELQSFVNDVRKLHTSDKE